MTEVWHFACDCATGQDLDRAVQLVLLGLFLHWLFTTGSKDET